MLDLFRLDTVLILTQDRCTICVKRTTGSEIILDAPDGTPRRLGHVEFHFGPFWRQCWCQFKIGAQFAPNIP
jgi:hypothetical protein